MTPEREEYLRSIANSTCKDEWCVDVPGVLEELLAEIDSLRENLAGREDALNRYQRYLDETEQELDRVRNPGYY